MSGIAELVPVDVLKSHQTSSEEETRQGPPFLVCKQDQPHLLLLPQMEPIQGFTTPFSHADDEKSGWQSFF